jgi:trigger factor
LNIQIEHLENHTARLTVEVAPERLEKAMQAASRRIARKVNIPGFRKGKAPYPIIVRYVGEGAVLEEAIGELGNEIYHEALEESKIEPYAPGSLEDVKTEPSVQLVFTVAKQPVVSLGDYRAIRLPFEEPVVEDERVTEAMKQMQESRALVEPADRGSRLEDVVKVKIIGHVIHPAHEHSHPGSEAESEPEAQASAAESGETAESAEATETPPDAHEEREPEQFIDDEIEILLTEDAKRDFIPGFSAHMVGLRAGEEKSFSLSFADDYEDKNLAGHTYNFQVMVQEVRSRIVPELNDDFAKMMSEGEVDNLLDLRIRVRKDLQEAMMNQARKAYYNRVLDQVIEGAEVLYPEEMVEEFTTDVLQTLDNNLRRQGLSLTRLMQVQGKDEAAMRADYRDMAIRQLKRSLVLRELMRAEGLSASDADVEQQIETLTARFSEQTREAETFRRMLNQPANRRGIAYDMVMERLADRLIAIARGEDPPIATPSTDAAPDAQPGAAQEMTGAVEAASASAESAGAEETAAAEPSETAPEANPDADDAG